MAFERTPEESEETPLAPEPSSAGAFEEEERVSHDEVYPPEGVVVMADWVQRHGAGAGPREERCWDAGDRVGLPPAAGLVCETHTGPPSRTTASVYRLEGRKLRRVWKGVVGTWANWLELTVLLSPDGATLTVRDRGQHECEAAISEFEAKESNGVRGNFGRVLREGCAGRGAYPWQNDRYLRPKPR